MLVTLRGLLLAALAILPLAAQSATAAPWSEHRSLRVLYAGKPEMHREKAFQTFLGKWFDEVGTIDAEKLTLEAAKDYDVVILDWVSQYGNDGYPSSENSLFSVKLKLDPSFDRPIIAMSYVGSQVRRDHKLNWH